MSKSLTYVEIDIPAFTQNSPPDSPPIMETLRFTTDVSYLPSDIYAIPSIRNVQIQPTIISLGENLGQRTSVTVNFKDHKHIFGSESFGSGTFWGKFRARHGLTLRGEALRLISGTLGQTLEQMETRYFLIEATDGPTTDGIYKIIAKDVLKLTDGDRALAPALSPGSLIADITETDFYATLTPTDALDQYPDTGYIAIGGQEIIFYGKESHTKLWLQGDGTDGTQNIVDSSRSLHSLIIGGNAQHDTAQSQQGGSSILFDGTGDFVRLDASPAHTDFVLGTGDFTLRMFVRLNTVGTLKHLIDGRNSGASTATPRLYIASGDNTLRYHVNGTDVITGATSLTTGAWFHVEVARVSGNTRMFLNGTQQGSTFVDAVSYIMQAQRPVFGISGDGLATNPHNGWIDELQWIKGTGLHSANFTAPTTHADTGTVSGTDVITLTTRAQFETEATSHSGGDRVQEVLIYDGQDPADIISDLLQTYANVPSSYIPLANWQAETDAFLSRVYSAAIAEPTSVNKLIGELIEQAALAVWPDEVNQQIRLQVLRAIPTTADVYDPANILINTLEVKEQPEKRLTRVEVYFGQRNPLLNLDQLENYRSTAIVEDLVAEAEYGSPAIKQIFSRWIPTGGETTAERLGEIQLGRFVDPPRHMSFNLLRHSVLTPELGGGYQLEAWPFQDTSGDPVQVPIQIIRLNPLADRWEVEAEEMLFEATETDPQERIIIIDSNELNINLRELHDSLFPDPEPGDTVTCIIQEGVIVGSSSTTTAAFIVGDWAVGSPAVPVTIELKGRIQGMGGRGGANDAVGGDGENGLAGGTALFTRYAISLILNTGDGEVFGGGGGGGGTDGGAGGGSGGGGAGHLLGVAGAANTGGAAGVNGTTEAGGAGGNGTIADGGAGGNPGLAGAAATDNALSGGAAGTAIDGISFVTKTGTGDVRGAEVN